MYNDKHVLQHVSWTLLWHPLTDTSSGACSAAQQPKCIPSDALAKLAKGGDRRTGCLFQRLLLERAFCLGFLVNSMIVYESNIWQ